jgi:DNA modification methylase
MTRNSTKTASKPEGWRNRICGSGEEDPGSLVANPRNWRLHPKAQQDALAGVLAEVGWVQEVIVNKVTGLIVDGHLRVALAAERGEPMVPVKYVELTPGEEALILATLDPLAAMAETAVDALEALLADVSSRDGAVEGLLECLAKGAAVERTKALLTDPDDVPEAPAQPISQRGDVWLCGEHRVMCGDSTDPADVARLMAGEAAEVLWTDPPYGAAYEGKTKEALTIENDDPAGLASLLAAAFGTVDAALVPGARLYVAAPAGPHNLTFRQAFVGAGWRFHEGLVWVKDVLVLGHSDYHLQHEDVLYGWKDGPGRPGRGNHRGSRWYGGHAQTSVFHVDRPKRSAEHPTMKPVELVAAMIANSSRPGDPVLDPFLGSGSTMIAAERTGRRCYGMEIDPRYADVAVRRWEGATGRHAEILQILHASGGNGA